MKKHDPVRIPWRPIEPLADADCLTNGSLGALSALRQEWQRRIDLLTEEERGQIRRRSLRRLSVETGIIERLYNVDWGLTLTLVAEGFTRDVVERAQGKVDERTLATLRSQMDSLELVLDFVRQDRLLSASFIKELHQAITRTQETYIATDALGRVVETELPRGEWKRQPNHVLRKDDSILEYAPPEQVASEVDQLVEIYSDLDQRAVHPMVKAAWLHHRFVQIHPFADGNGRVARALTLLVIEKHKYAPLVIDRWHRDAYLTALDVANQGSLVELIRLFVRLESAALVSELERPESARPVGHAIDVAHTLAAQLEEARGRRLTSIQTAMEARAVAVSGRISAWFDGQGEEIKEAFRRRGLRGIRVFSDNFYPPHVQTHWFRRQIIDTAHRAGHYADFGGYTGWSRLRVVLDAVTLRFVASVHGAGREPGVMAVTTFAEIEGLPTELESVSPNLVEVASEGDSAREARDRTIVRTSSDAFRFVHTESFEELEARSEELVELLDGSLAVALGALLQVA